MKKTDDFSESRGEIIFLSVSVPDPLVLLFNHFFLQSFFFCP